MKEVDVVSSYNVGNVVFCPERKEVWREEGFRLL